MRHRALRGRDDNDKGFKAYESHAWRIPEFAADSHGFEFRNGQGTPVLAFTSKGKNDDARSANCCSDAPDWVFVRRRRASAISFCSQREPAGLAERGTCRGAPVEVAGVRAWGGGAGAGGLVDGRDGWRGFRFHVNVDRSCERQAVGLPSGTGWNLEFGWRPNCHHATVAPNRN